MTRRLRPIFALLLALLVGGTSSQAKVCELTCGLDVKGAACRIASASRQEATEAMPHRHCSPATHAARSAGVGAAFSGLHPAACGHALNAAIENAVAARARLVSHPELVQSSSNEIAIRRVSALFERHPPPRSSSHHSLVVTLRI